MKKGESNIGFTQLIYDLSKLTREARYLDG